MQPLLNLKSVLATLIILIVPAALLVAYFRNYSPEGGGHEHSGAAGGDKSATKSVGDENAMKPGHDMSKMKSGGDKNAMKQGGDEGAMKPGHDMSKMKSGGDKNAMKQGGDESAMKPDHDMNEMNPGGDMSPVARSSALAGIPGVSRLYHIGARGFFLNHSEHITLTIKQQAAINRLKQKALLNKSTVQRKIEEAEQTLWEQTGADEPDNAQIQANVQAIEKLRGEQRMALIRAVGDAAKLLTDEQRQALLGTEEDKR